MLFTFEQIESGQPVKVRVGNLAQCQRHVNKAIKRGMRKGLAVSRGNWGAAIEPGSFKAVFASIKPKGV